MCQQRQLLLSDYPLHIRVVVVFLGGHSIWIGNIYTWYRDICWHNDWEALTYPVCVRVCVIAFVRAWDSASNMNKYNGCHKYNLQESEAVHAPEKKLRLKRSATLVDTPPPKSPKHEDPPESASPKPVSLTQFATTSVIQVLDAASRHVQPQYMSYNISHLKMTNLITTLMAETEDNNDSLPISCELMTAHPGRSHDTYLIAAAILVVSAKCDEQPHALIGTLSVKPGHLSVIHKHLIFHITNLQFRECIAKCNSIFLKMLPRCECSV